LFPFESIEQVEDGERPGRSQEIGFAKLRGLKKREGIPFRPIWGEIVALTDMGKKVGGRGTQKYVSMADGKDREGINQFTQSDKEREFFEAQPQGFHFKKILKRGVANGTTQITYGVAGQKRIRIVELKHYFGWGGVQAAQTKNIEKGEKQ